MTNELDEAIRGCLLGGAVGDALGAPIEFAHWPEIKEMFGPTGVTEVLDPGHFTDDTQMTLFTAEALLIAAVEMERTGVCLPRTLLHHAYLRWLVTQAGELPAVQIPAEEPLGWLLDVPLLHRVEAPGLTCLGALESGDVGTVRQPINDSKGCGGVMRAAPAAFLVPGCLPGAATAEAYELGCEVAAITHGHQGGIEPAGVLAAIISELLRGEDLWEATTTARALTSAEMGRYLDRALSVAADGVPSPERIEAELGAGWVGDEALCIALACALASPDVETGLLASVNHSGDTDSTGAICGNLLGARDGASGIPQEFLDAVDGIEFVEQIADDCLEWTRYLSRDVESVSPQFVSRYGALHS